KNPADQGDSVTFTATVTPTQGTGLTPDGTIQFKDNGVAIGSPIVCADAGSNTCAAQVATSSLLPPSRNITAEYSGGTNHDPSTSATVVQTIIVCTANPTVINTNDSGAGSLRQAIADACQSPGSNTITLDGALSGSIDLTSGELLLTRNVIITAAGPLSRTIQRTSGTSRLFHVNPAVQATLDHVTLTGGNESIGAAILNQPGTLALANAVNDGHGATSAQGGAIFNDQGTLTVSESTIRNNGGTSTTGGGLFNNAAASSATVTVAHSVISTNTASTGGGLYNSATGAGTATATITNSTISGNTATGGGGGLVSNGANAVMPITNATITLNHSDNDDTGGESGGGIRIINSTATTLNNTIVAKNYVGSGTTTFDDVFGALDGASSHNLIGDGTGMTGVANGVNGNQVGSSGNAIDPLLGPLAANGGLTQTHTLLFGSPAIDAGDNALVVGTTDQRGTSFGRIKDGPDAAATATLD